MIDLESYLIPAMEGNVSTEQLLNDTSSAFTKANLINSVNITKGTFQGYDSKVYDDSVIISTKVGITNNPREMRMLTDKVENVLKEICKKHKLVYRQSYGTRQYVYTFGDINTKYFNCYGVDRTLSFFGKTWNAEIKYDHVIPAEADKHIDAFIKKSSSISKSIENEFCNICNRYYSEIGIAANLKKYSEIKDLTLTRIVAMTDRDTDKIFIKLCGGYDVDYEHGWSIKFYNNKWTGYIGDFMDDE